MKPSAERDLAALPRHVLRRVDARIRALGKDPRPRGAEKLRGSGNIYRVRVGDYRILYAVEDDRCVVLVVRVRHRREAYRR